ncbi:DUF721 domain-containing protein [Myxococcota bacterium]|nr:DUF721 domain-containing protein [Myxococcota bacterium]
MARLKKPVAVADVVARFLAERQGHTSRPDGALSLRVFEAFQRIGPPITDHAEVASFRRGVLSLTVGDSAWLTELTFLRAEILTRLNLALGRDVVKDLRMRPGTIGKRRAPTVRPAPVLSAAEAEKVDRWTAEIDDPELRAIVARAAARSITEPKKGPEPYRGPPGPRLHKIDPEPNTPSPDRFVFPPESKAAHEKAEAARRDRWSSNKRRR